MVLGGQGRAQLVGSEATRHASGVPTCRHADGVPLARWTRAAMFAVLLDGGQLDPGGSSSSEDVGDAQARDQAGEGTVSAFALQGRVGRARRGGRVLATGLRCGAYPSVGEVGTGL